MWITCGYVDNSEKKMKIKKLSTYPHMQKSYPHVKKPLVDGVKKSYPHIHITRLLITQKTRVFIQILKLIPFVNKPKGKIV